MMSQILLINGILNILICGLFFFYTNKYRTLMSKGRMIMFSSFSLYFLFIGFLRLRVAMKVNDWSLSLIYNNENVFNTVSMINGVIIIIFLYLSITYKGKIIHGNNNENNTVV